MKFIHCADLHLDAKMSANLDKDKAKIRKTEILHTFERMVEYAAEHDVFGILIAGDMFDTKNITATTKNAVLYQINSHPDITFFYLNGNHDNDNFLANLDVIPENLKMFGPNWTTYDFGKVVITGIDLSTENTSLAHASLMLELHRLSCTLLR